MIGFEKKVVCLLTSSRHTFSHDIKFECQCKASPLYVSR